MASENKTLWPWLARARATFKTRLHMRRVENLVGVGDGDVEGCLDGVGFDLELKVAARPARASTGIRFGEPLKEGQVQFAEDRLAAGGAHGFLIQVGDHPEASRYLVPGTFAKKLEAERLPESWFTPYLVKTPDEVIRRAVTLRSK